MRTLKILCKKLKAAEHVDRRAKREIDKVAVAFGIEDSDDEPEFV
jgi:hypothetical protein